MTPSPLRVLEPISDLHVARLIVDQRLDLVFSKKHLPELVEPESPYLKLLQVSEDGRGNVVYQFSQMYNFEQWARVSSVGLGRIDITYKTGLTSCVSAYLESSAELKKDVLCCINPISDHVRVLPQSVIEMVVFGPMVEKDIDVQIFPGESGYTVEQIGHAIVDPDDYPESMNTSDMYCICPRAIGSKPLEHHFFFRCNSATISKISEVEEGKVDLGLILMGRLDGSRDGVLHSLYLQLKIKKEKDRIFDMLLVPRLEQCQGVYLSDGDRIIRSLKNKYGGIKRGNRRNRNRVSHDHYHHHHYNGFDYDDYDDYELYRYASGNYKKPEPTNNDLEITILESSLTSNCTVTTTLERFREMKKNVQSN